VAIKSNKKIDFEYECKSSDELISFSLRFYQTPEYGPTIAVLNAEGESAIDFPVNMFKEVCEFLIEQGILEGSKKEESVSLPTIPRPNAGKPSMPLPKPKIISNKKPVVQSDSFKRDVIPLDLETDTGEDDLDIPEDMKEAILAEKAKMQESIDSATPVHSLSNRPQIEQPAFSEDEIRNMIAEREKASKKASTEKTIRKAGG
jgi:hypothetical protein